MKCWTGSAELKAVPCLCDYWADENETAVQNKDVTEAIQKVAAAYDCKIAEGVLSHQMKQFVIDANKVILSVTNPETRVDDAEFEENEVYAVDIVTSTGDGKVYSLHYRLKIGESLYNYSDPGSIRVTHYCFLELDLIVPCQ